MLSQADGLQIERIAALEPDLILGHQRRSRRHDLRPAVGDRTDRSRTPTGAEGYFSPWHDQTLMIGQALGKEAEAQALVDDVDEQFAAAAAEHPEFAGTRAVFLQNAFYDGQAIAYQEGLSTEFLTDLGFEIPTELDPFVQEAEGSQAYIPLEQLSRARRGRRAALGHRGRRAIERPSRRSPCTRPWRRSSDGRLVFTDGLDRRRDLLHAALSLPYVLEVLVPALASTLAGEGPATAAGAPTEG